MTRKKIYVAVNSGVSSALFNRAMGLFKLMDEYDVIIAHRIGSRFFSMITFFKGILFNRPNLVYVVDTSISGSIAALASKIILNTFFIVDTGDLGYELARLNGRPNWFFRQGIRLVEYLVIRYADAVVVRGTYHKSLLTDSGRKDVHVVRDGTYTDRYLKTHGFLIKHALNLSDFFCVGIVGSLTWNPRYQICYGWDLVEAMSLIDKSLPIKAVIIGDGDGQVYLKKRCQELGINERIVFINRVSYDELPQYLDIMDICISTQTNNSVGNVRTTGKLVEYMAAAKFIIASNVGEARLILPQNMLVSYDGIVDKDYPQKIASKIEEIYFMEPEVRLELCNKNASYARRYLDYKYLSDQIRNIIMGLI